MRKLCIDLPPLAPDYSGAASALFDMGGVVVMHDASGCTGNYTGFDEPRWLGSRSALYCSGMRSMDAIMGNDDKFIRRTLDAAESIKPSIIAYLGSPVPMVIGTDLEGMAAETEAESGIPSFGFNTTGECYYDKGASDVYMTLIKRFADIPEKKSDNKKRVNIIGLIPIDFGNKGNDKKIYDFVSSLGYEITAKFAMGLDVEQVRACTKADINIVVSRSGLDTAEYMKKKYNIPYICAVPLNDGSIFTSKLDGSFTDSRPEGKSRVIIIHEQVFANSLRDELNKRGISADVGSMFGLDKRISEKSDLDLPDESTIRKLVNSGRYDVVIADPQIKQLIKNEKTNLVSVPHVAVSSKLHWNEYLDYLSGDIENVIQKTIDYLKLDF
ncbi:MAG: oxidoreductase [Oscillospiraceae bacterium]|nr:oxidoreductase [Oscillospiraceae bacterium]